jgi:hypothetical protein
LAGTQRLTHENQLGFRFPRSRGHLVDLAPADEESRVRPLAARLNLGDDGSARRLSERAEFLVFVFVRGTFQADMQQQRTFATAGSIKQPGLPARRSCG